MSDGTTQDRPLALGRVAEFFDTPDGAVLLSRIRSLPGPRILIAVAGPPGSGKSSLAAALVTQLPDAALVPMDGFHLDDSVLEARNLRQRKGAVETFDAAGFAALTQRLREPGVEVIYPVFDRSRELSLAGAGVVAPSDRFIILEGNYLLLDARPWSAVSYDLTLSLSVPRPELQRRLTRRWQRLGKSADQIQAHLANDLANADVVINQSRKADVVLACASR